MRAKFCYRKAKARFLSILSCPRLTSQARRGGNGYEFWTPGDAMVGRGQWAQLASGALDGGPLPADPVERAMWQKFWGDDFTHIRSSNRRNVVPGAWRVEVSPSRPQLEDHFLHLIEIGDQGRLADSAFNWFKAQELQELGAPYRRGRCRCSIFNSRCAARSVEVTLPSFPCHTLWLEGLETDSCYDLELTRQQSGEWRSACSGCSFVSLRVRTNKPWHRTHSIGH